MYQPDMERKRLLYIVYGTHVYRIEKDYTSVLRLRKFKDTVIVGAPVDATITFKFIDLPVNVFKEGQEEYRVACTPTEENFNIFKQYMKTKKELNIKEG